MADFGKYYRAYMYMQELLKPDFTYNYINASFTDGDKGEDTLDGRTNEKVIDMDWVIDIEDALPYIQKAIDEQRRFIKQVENVVRIELAKKVGPDSVKHLSQHTNYIAKVENGMVTPNKILTVEREESFAIYENRVLITLIRKALHFVDDKYAKMKDVPDDSYNKLSVTRHLEMNQQKVDFVINYINESHETLADDLDVLDVTELSDFDRIRRIRTSLNECLNSAVMREIAREPEVRPPLTQTNLLKKNPNFKKAVELWTFLDSYKRSGFDIVGEDYNGKMSEQVQQDVYFSMGFQHFMMSIATNPALRKMLHQKYEDENAKLQAESKRPEKARESVMKAKIDAVRKEEMEIRLREIREREKKIVELNNEIKNLKVTIEQKEQMILTLKGQISAMQDEMNVVKEELQKTKVKLVEAQKRIKALEEENTALKAEIDSLNNKIDELNETINRLNKQITVLNDRIQVLMQENARQQTKIVEQEKKIAEQTDRISVLEKENAEQSSLITTLTADYEKASKELEESLKKVTFLTEKTENLTNNLIAERKLSQEKTAKMQSDFSQKTKRLEERFNNDLRKLQSQLEDEANDKKAQLEAMNNECLEKLKQKDRECQQKLVDKDDEFQSQALRLKQAGADAVAAENEKCAAEIKKIQKAADRRIEAEIKAAEKRMQSKINEYKKQAQNEIRTAEKKAKEKATLAKDEAKSVKGFGEIFARDYAFGCMNLISLYADSLAKQGSENISAVLSGTSKNIKSINVIKSKKGVVFSEYSQAGTEVIKLYKKSADLKVVISDIPQQLKGINSAPVCVLYSGVDKTFASDFLKAVKSAVSNEVTLVNNKNLKAGEFISIYFCKE